MIGAFRPAIIWYVTALRQGTGGYLKLLFTTQLEDWVSPSSRYRCRHTDQL